MKDGEPDFSKYTAAQIERALSSIDRDKYPLNYANLLAAQKALPSPVDEAVLAESHIIQLRQDLQSGEVWLSSGSTWIMITVLTVACLVPLVWVARKFLFNPEIEVLDFPGWNWDLFTLEDVWVSLLGTSCLLACVSVLPRIRRLVMRQGVLEVRGYFTREIIDLRNIERVRWDDRPEQKRSRAAVIELRVAGRFGRYLRFFPRSRPTMHAFAAHVAAVSGRANVADPACRSAFFVSDADP